MRTAEVSRNTAETRIRVAVNLDGTGQAWWGRRIPRNLLSAAGEPGEEEA